MPAPRKISERQTELLVDFIEANPRIAMGCYPRGPQSTRISRQIWKSVALKLNSVTDGTKKTPQQWRRYWIDFKAKTKAKAADSRRHEGVTAGGPNKLMPLNTMEKRVLAFTGSIAVDQKPEDSLPVESSDINLETDSNMHEEWLEVEMSPTPGSQSVSLPASVETESEKVQPTGISPYKEKTGADEKAPRWVFDIETRRLASEERNAAALEAIVKIMQEIKNDIHSYVNRLNSETLSN